LKAVKRLARFLVVRIQKKVLQQQLLPQVFSACCVCLLEFALGLVSAGEFMLCSAARSRTIVMDGFSARMNFFRRQCLRMKRFFCAVSASNSTFRKDFFSSLRKKGTTTHERAKPKASRKACLLKRQEVVFAATVSALPLRRARVFFYCLSK